MDQNEMHTLCGVSLPRCTWQCGLLSTKQQKGDIRKTRTSFPCKDGIHCRISRDMVADLIKVHEIRKIAVPDANGTLAKPFQLHWYNKSPKFDNQFQLETINATPNNAGAGSFTEVFLNYRIPCKVN